MKKIFLTILTSALLFSACSEKNTELAGAGATFPQPFYNVVFKEFAEQNNVNVTYGGIGSGGGVRSLKDKTVDFGASDAFLSDKELKDFGAEVVHIPTAMGAVVLCYNLQRVKGLKLTSEIISDIYRDKITNWNDPKIKALNPELNLPDKKITAVYRSDGSGTTYVFSDYMSKADENWKKEIGTGKTISVNAAPQGNAKVAAKGNPGVAGIIAQTDGAIGYVGSEYAFAMNLNSALLKNRSGNFVEADAQSISAAADVDIPEDTRVSITNSENPNAYPVSCFTWILVYKEQNYNNRTAEQAKALVDLLKYVTGKDGQDFAVKTHYAEISDKAKNKAETLLKSITYGGKSVLN
ncbi:MAG: phosphate ABC transporter substrate-binding protein PstS [Flavobacteriaceae bacterium]|jgi:phosphate transport system substrate-binding protein|nr:phosphate ABC transporter substrate-binding protein PstS [Flavobacteriaceae bacterium]